MNILLNSLQKVQNNNSVQYFIKNNDNSHDIIFYVKKINKNKTKND